MTMKKYPKNYSRYSWNGKIPVSVREAPIKESYIFCGYFIPTYVEILYLTEKEGVIIFFFKKS